MMSLSRNFLPIAAALALTAAVLPQAGACFMQSPLPVQVWADHIEVEITDLVAVKKYHCVFYNPNPQAVVGGECYMEVEPGAQVDNLSLLVDGKETKAEILDVEKAKEVFAEILREGGSPALLEFYGSGLIRSQVPTVPPNGKVTVQLQYTMPLKRENGLVRMQMLNTNPKALMQALQSASVRIKIRSAEPVTNVYSPTHEIKIVEAEDADVQVEWSQESYLPKTPFVFYFAVSEDPLGANAWCHREGGEAGFFMLRVAPALSKAEELAPVARDVVFCVDTSGSMVEEGLIEQAKAALRHGIEGLREGDRFDVITFGTEARSLSEGRLLDVTADTKARALGHVDRLGARGGTAIQEALTLALSRFREDGDRLRLLLFLTDGRPSIGERDPDLLLRAIETANAKKVRIFAFGVGNEVNTYLLDNLARGHGGETAYVLPSEKIDDKVRPFFAKLSSPVLTDVKVQIEGVDADEIYPKSIPDLFLGSPITLFGRYEGQGNAVVTLTGRSGGEERTFRYTLPFPGAEPRNDFVPRLWAGRAVGYLLDAIRRGGENRELVDEVVRLAKRYGIVTPYTSYLLVQDVVNGGLAAAEGEVRKKAEAHLGAGRSAEAPAPGASAKQVEEAERFGRFRNQSGADGFFYFEQADRELAAAGGSGSAMSVMRYIGAKTFYLSGDVWYDSVYEPEKHKDLRALKVGDDSYFRLIAEKPGMAKYLALGAVVVEFEGVFYKVEPRAEEKR